MSEYFIVLEKDSSTPSLIKIDSEIFDKFILSASEVLEISELSSKISEIIKTQTNILSSKINLDSVNKKTLDNKYVLYNNTDNLKRGDKSSLLEFVTKNLVGGEAVQSLLETNN